MLLRTIIVIQNEIFKRFFQFSSDKMTLCNNNNQTWFSDTLTSASPLGGSLKPSPFRLGFQHHPQGPADVKAKEKHV